MAVRGDEVDPGGQLELLDEALIAPGCGQADMVVPNGSARGPNGRRARLTLGEAARIIRKAVKDNSYRKTPLGQLVGRYQHAPRPAHVRDGAAPRRRR